MKVYESNKYNFRYPCEMELILNYLNENGKIFVSPKVIEELYEEFSRKNYCRSWKTVTTDNLWTFACWLEDYDYEGEI